MKKFSSLFSALVCSCITTALVMQTNAAQINGSDVLIIGDSFFAMSNEIKHFLEVHAREDGIIGANESFRSAAVSGAVLSQIAQQYSNTNPKPKWVIMDAGGNDCLRAQCSNPVTINCQGLRNALNDVQPMLDNMKANGTIRVLWMHYPEPQGAFAGSLKPKLDALMPEIKKVCEASTAPEVLWVDLRPVWGNNSSYTTDGIHPTTAGSRATADAFWEAIKENDFFNLTTEIQPYRIATDASSALLGQNVGNNHISLSLFLAQPSAVSILITTISGRTILSTTSQMQASGLRTVQFYTGSIVPGMYCLEVKAEQFSKSSSFLVR